MWLKAAPSTRSSAGLAQLGYHVESNTLKAEEFGVPQERRRLFFLGSRCDQIRWPSPTHAAARDLFELGKLKPLVTVEEAIGDLPPLNNNDGAEEMAYASNATSEYQSQARGRLRWSL